MVNIDWFHRFLTISNKIFDDKVFTVQDIVHDDPIINSHMVPISSNTYHVNDRSDSSRIGKFFLYLLSKLPIQDIDNQWKDEKDALKGIIDYYGKIIKTDRVAYYNDMAFKVSQMSQVKFLKMLGTEGMGSHLMKYDIESKTWSIDLLYMFNYEVRNGLLF